MALLSLKKRKEYFKRLGLTYNKEGIRKLQKKYFTRPQDIDGDYGKDTDTLLRHVINVKSHTKNFEPEEFKCRCGGRWCTGYPTRMKVKELKHIQTIRDHYGKPMIITDALRCRRRNESLPNSAKDSPHMHGYAVDFYMQGHTDTAQQRQQVIRYCKKLKGHKYTYANGCYDSNGTYIRSDAMGNAVHTNC